MASLVADYGSTSGSEENDSEVDSEDSNRSASIQEPESDDPKLENPFRGRRPGAKSRPSVRIETQSEASESLPDLPASSSASSSVFANPFRAAEDAKKALLEKHVKMSPTPQEVTTINGRQICWNYRKGRCHFGHRCKFAHDSDLPKGGGTLVETEVGASNEHHQQESHQSRESKERSPPDPEEPPQGKRRKRPGLTRTLLPGKKVMNNFRKQQVKEAPWVVASKGTT